MTLEAIEKRDALVAEIEARHIKIAFRYGASAPYTTVDICREEHQDWPCDAAYLLSELRALRSSNEELRKALGEAVDVATWMSGSSSFSPEGEAAEGWEKARPKLDAARSLLADEPAQALRRAADEVGS